MGLWDKVSLGGKLVTRADRDLIRAAYREIGLDPKTVILAQGSWNLGSLSAGTHAASGAWDIDVRNVPSAKQIPLVVACRKRGAGCTYLRSRAYGWTSSGAHIHGMHGCGDTGDDPGMSAPGKRQVQAWVRGENGLANGGRDPFPRPKIWPLVEWHNCGLGKRNGDVVLVQKALGILADGYWGPKTQAKWLAYCLAHGRTGINALSLLGYSKGFRPGV
jgi:hypothetical protein